ncbi:S8 family serine peptidase [Leptothrix sp. BB-4]
MPLPSSPSPDLRPDRRPHRHPGLLAWLGVAAVLVMASPGLQPLAQAAASAQAPQRLIVKYRQAEAAAGRAQARRADAGSKAEETDDSTQRRAGTLSQRHGLSLRDGPPVGTGAQVMLVDAGQDSREVQRRLAADPEIEYVEEDRIARKHAAPNDPRYAAGGGTGVEGPAAGQWYLRSPDATLRSAINAENAWTISNGSADVVVAVLDTGVRPDHPDLVGKMLPGYDFVSDVYVANDGDGRDGDPSDPGDWVTSTDRTNSPNSVCAGAAVEPSSWHGTQMAGLVAAATQNGVGMAGSGRHVRIVPIRVLGKCGGYTSDIADGIRWAAGLRVAGVPDNANPARVISLSLGGNSATCSTTYQQAITAARAAGAIVVSSAGNEGLAVGDPANCTGVIAVGGLDHDGYKAYFSNLGSRVTISAPSGDGACVTLSCLYPILSTVNKGSQTPGVNGYTNGTTDRAAGTSYSTPLVAGVAGLLLSVRPDATPDQLTAWLTSSARAFPSGLEATCTAPAGTAQARCGCTTATCGAGMLDATAALTLAISGGPPVANIEPSSTQIGVGTSLVLDGGRSRNASSGVGTLTYAWDIVEGGGIASFETNPLIPSLRTLTIGATGIVKVRLTVSNGTQSASSTVVLRAGEAAVAVGTATPQSSGGGALQPGWLFGLAAAVLALAWLRREPLRRAADA